MGFLDRIFGRTPKPDITRRTVPECVGSMTAHGAWTVAYQIAEQHDRQATLTLITSGTDLNGEGRSRTWEFIFILPSCKSTLMISLEPDPQCEDVDYAPCVLTQRFNPITPSDRHKPSLPVPFLDSPEAVAEFTARGVDYEAGPSDMKLEGRALPSGEAMWITYYWGKEFAISFVAECT